MSPDWGQTPHAHIVYTLETNTSHVARGSGYTCTRSYASTHTHTHIYPFVEGRHVKMPTGSKHRQQCDREFLAGVVYIYGFSSWKPQWPMERKKKKEKGE